MSGWQSVGRASSGPALAERRCAIGGNEGYSVAAWFRGEEFADNRFRAYIRWYRDWLDLGDEVPLQIAGQTFIGAGSKWLARAVARVGLEAT